ncbi:MAG: tripartite tricarboxylate transporter TctB family protein [Deltaproteobacteria bacterium]|nr:tripartite tricarboxylate transporter TctB family protein [Deltaproteobacteria bacterium]
MRKTNVWMAVFLFIIGSICIFDAVRLGFKYDPTMGPGPGYLPFYLALGVMIGSAIIFYRGLKKLKAEGAGGPLIPEGGLKPILWVLIPSTVMVTIIPILGLHISAMVYIIFYMKVVGKIELYKCFLVGILFPVALYIIFDRMFLIPLPMGMLGDVIQPLLG